MKACDDGRPAAMAERAVRGEAVRRIQGNLPNLTHPPGLDKPCGAWHFPDRSGQSPVATPPGTGRTHPIKESTGGLPVELLECPEKRSHRLAKVSTENLVRPPGRSR